MSWLFDTLIWTGALIALVLVLRRPVAKHFGAKAAYALWALPMVRLVMPPIVLPAWMAPAPEPLAVLPAAEAPSGGSLIISVTESTPVAATPAAIDWLPFIVGAWLLGATVFLFLRFRAYRRMRDLLLSNAVEAGQVGDVRLVETPLTEAPIAFGVRDKIVALPEAFLDTTERQVRDLALEHELAHHRGHDLLVNFAVQPLFALHWFNPLAWLGWRAMRCDQEAACDARVVEKRSRRERAEYAQVIAGFATGPRLALAAPMACPVLGDKSIIHRLRSLTMNDLSTRRRRIGLAGLVAAAIALPLTATTTYAEEPQIPAPPAPPAAPAAPSNIPAPPAPPAPPNPPTALAPVALQAAGDAEFAEAMRDIDQDGEVREERRVYVIKDVEHEHDGSAGEHSPHKEHKVEIRKFHSEGLTKEEREEIKVEIAEAMAEMREGVAEARAAHKVAMIEMRDSMGEMAKIEVNCDSNEPVSEKVGADGKKVTVICQTAITAQAMTALKEARKAIAVEQSLDAEIRAEVLKSLDEEIARMEREG